MSLSCSLKLSEISSPHFSELLDTRFSELSELLLPHPEIQEEKTKAETNNKKKAMIYRLIHSSSNKQEDMTAPQKRRRTTLGDYKHCTGRNPAFLLLQAILEYRILISNDNLLCGT